MCAQFTLHTKKNIIEQLFSLPLLWQTESQAKSWDLRVRGFIKTDLSPIIFWDGSAKQFVVTEMAYSLCPSWSPEYPYKWSTYNARLDRPGKNNQLEYIYQVPTWRDVFKQGKTCLVPMSGAIESSYFGTQAGNMIQFFKPLNKDLSPQKLNSKTDHQVEAELKAESILKEHDVFFALGLWSDWLDKKTGEIKKTFALLTDDPYPFFYECGHDRSILIIDPQNYKDWLMNQKMSAQERYHWIKTHRSNQDWAVEVDRPMAKGWEKRKPSDEEIQSIKIWKV